MAATSKAAAVLILVPVLWALCAPAQAQLRVMKSTAPKNLPPAEAEIWPYPAPDPQSWWDDPRPKAPEEADPLGERRASRSERAGGIDNGIEPTTYRLWGLPPLQTQVVRSGEMILEVWTRPSRGVRQAVIRITVRGDGRAFVQGRAGEACCEPGIARRVGFDAELPPDAGPKFLALRDDPMWASPRDVRAVDPRVSAGGVCIDGVSYDLTLVVPGRTRVLRRACDDVEIGQVADALAPAVGAALGHEPRFDVLFRRGSDFASAKAAYADLVQNGGSLRPDPQARPQTAEASASDAAEGPAAP
jgi:hypothetical protein